MDSERLAFEHIQSSHLTDDKYEPILMWSTPVEEVAHMRSLGICIHQLEDIYHA